MKIYKLFLSKLSFYIALLLCLGVIPLTAFAQQDEMITIVVKENQNVRSLAQEYLNDPDLWEEILRVNKLASAADVKPGMKLKIPANVISRANAELAKSQGIIETATQTGAKIFASANITKAIDLHNKAIGYRQTGNWEECYRTAQSASKEAQTALDICLAQRNVAAEAILNDSKGTVQSRKSKDLVWADTPQDAKLAEGEKIRTLSASFAEILFRDESRLRLDENSQAVIQKMRVNLLENKDEASVSLVEGDAYALLAGNRQKKKFDFIVPGVQTKVKSTNFWASHKGKGKLTRFANYEGELEVASKGGKVVLKKNQGTKIVAGQKPTAPRILLPTPTLISPSDDTTLYKNQTVLSWATVKNSDHYFLEIASNSSFKRIIRSEKNARKTKFSLTRLDDGVYYWRVAAVDVDGFPGPKSKIRIFKIINDTRPPYLIVNSPEDEAVIQKSPAQITGETEGDAKLTLDGKSVQVSSDGRFEFQHPLKKGINEITFEAIDLAGNVTKIVRAVNYFPGGKVHIDYDSSLVQIASKHFTTQDAGFTLIANTIPGVLVSLKYKMITSFGSRTFSDDEGNFRFSIPLSTRKEEIGIAVTAPTGHLTEDRFTVEIDDTPPQIQLEQEPPPVATNKNLQIQGQIKGGNHLKLNDKDVQLFNNGRFDQTITLKHGKNKIRFAALDRVGNIAFLEREVIFDNKPPKATKYQYSQKTATGGERVYIKVTAEDESGMKGGAKFKLQVGSFTYTGFLRLCRSEECYETTINLPKNAKGQIKLKYLKLEDYNGNAKEYNYK